MSQTPKLKQRDTLFIGTFGAGLIVGALAAASAKEGDWLGWFGAVGGWVGGLGAVAAVVWAVKTARAEREEQRQEARDAWRQRAQELTEDAVHVTYRQIGHDLEDIPASSSNDVATASLKGPVYVTVENQSPRTVFDVRLDSPLLRPTVPTVPLIRPGLKWRKQFSVGEDAPERVDRRTGLIVAHASSSLTFRLGDVVFTRTGNDPPVYQQPRA